MQISHTHLKFQERIHHKKLETSSLKFWSCPNTANLPRHFSALRFQNNVQKRMVQFQEADVLNFRRQQFNISLFEISILFNYDVILA